MVELAEEVGARAEVDPLHVDGGRYLERARDEVGRCQRHDVDGRRSTRTDDGRRRTCPATSRRAREHVQNDEISGRAEHREHRQHAHERVQFCAGRHRLSSPSQNYRTDPARA